MVFVRKYFLWFLIGFFILLIPLLIQIYNTPTGYVPSGFISGGFDYATFIAKMKWGAAGHWTYINRYTTECTEPAPIYGFYLLLGHISKWTGLSVIWVYHLARSLIGALCLISLWGFLKTNTKSKTWLAFLLVITCMAGYWEYFDSVLNTKVAKMDLFLQAKVGTAFLTYPHYLVDLLAFLSIFHAYLADIPARRRICLSAIAGFLFSAVHVFLMAIILIPLIHGLLNKRTKEALQVVIPSMIAALPLTIIQYLAFTHIEWLRVWRDATATQFVSPLILLLAIHGVTGLLAWYKIVSEIKKLSFWSIWVLTASVMAYAMPLANRTEYIFFLAIPLGILASEVVEKIIGWLEERKNPTLTVIGVTLLLLLTSGYSILWMIPIFKADKTVTGKYPNYLPMEYVDTLANLDNEQAIVLCDTYTGNFMPAWTIKLKPYCAHPMETLNYEEKRKKVDAFYKGELPQLPEQIGAKYIIYEDFLAENDYGKLHDILGEPFIKGKHIAVWKRR
ncbi:hypothetical protein Dtox_2478 [Desulfofarcimen acetoxidans DSM 771]|uniref:Glycosyltransferase RgtA/B/C/D-like domain-containing protein n=1 Tax=Desulfofarcimen acetoxidans (strain ATCC 49208 / DSM 771 / KCTC 5769 / VKM B-1644 / 5575) TaxID=485916 RepID=C8W0N0_DESAS|nr:hypothetical protein Dtox_2478 [Desulfofarcimen acetoxidans DSM 771]